MNPLQREYSRCKSIISITIYTRMNTSCIMNKRPILKCTLTNREDFTFIEAGELRENTNLGSLRRHL